MRNTTTLALAAALLLGLPVAARADSNGATDNHLHSSMRTAHHSFGFRVGGYGYRNTEDPASGEWNDCRMNGLGIFGQRSMSEHLFAEAAVDMYSTAGFPDELASEEQAMDRVSALLSVAGGARVTLFDRLSPYVQLGVGAEVTRARLNGLEDRGVYPMGFFGFGGDLRVTRRFYVGMNVRTNVMKHYVHNGAGSIAAMTEPGHTALQSEYDAAAQAQFFLKLDM